MATSTRDSKSTKRQSDLGVVTRVLRLRIKDKHAKHLLEQSREVNQVWNYCNETSQRILERERRFCTGFDLDQLTAGATKEGLSLHSQTVQAISTEYCTRRRQFKRSKLRWRVSHGSRRSLGWIPFCEGKTAFDYALQFSINTGFMQSTPILLRHIDDKSLIDQAIEPIERNLDGETRRENLLDLLRAHKAKLQADSAMRQIADLEFAGVTP